MDPAGASSAEDILIPENRSLVVRGLLHGPLVEYAFASRGLGQVSKMLEAKNVSGYVQKLAKVSGVDFVDMYNWLSNAAHPAIGARVPYASEFHSHKTDTTTIRFYSRHPTSIQKGARRHAFMIADYAARATLAATDIGLQLLRRSLAVMMILG
jgi:hypothetical protein